ncbi:4-hydroxy-tetrahydrodipicolinate synthase [Paraburkholderia unamae]|nr:4-hydroxy-tetrahydrodipicolinate synthase [Paraburkholderia unamae]
MSLSRSDLAGMFPAIPTPLDALGEFDRPALKPVVDHLFDGGMSGVVVLGGTGEYLALTQRERVEVVEQTVAAAGGRGPVIAGVLAPGFREAVEAGKALTQAGADALMVVTPYYVAPTQASLRDYYKAYHEEVGTPVLLYEIPYKTMITVHPETVAGMVEDRSIIGMKACNPDIGHFMHVVSLVGDKMAVLSGEDHLLPVQLAIGAFGSIHATANLFPRQWKRIYDLARAGDLARALKYLDVMRPMMQAVFSEGNPGPLKAAMSMIGLPVGEALRPLKAPDAELSGRLRAIIAGLQERERNLTAA